MPEATNDPKIYRTTFFNKGIFGDYRVIHYTLSNVILMDENPLHSVNIGDIVTNMVPLCSLYRVSSYKCNLKLLAWFLPDLAYLIMLFILEMACTGTADHLKNE